MLTDKDRIVCGSNLFLNDSTYFLAYYQYAAIYYMAFELKSTYINIVWDVKSGNSVTYF